MKEKITKQELIENKLDSLSKEMVATLALASRDILSKRKPNNFIKTFANSLGLYSKDDIFYIDVAYRIFSYLYPSNPDYWKLQDERYQKIFDESCMPALVKYNNSMMKKGNKCLK